MRLVLPDLPSFTIFVVAALVLLVTPGPAVLYIVARSIDQGRGAGLVSVAGVHVGTLVHVAAAAGGLSALLAASAVAFTTLKYLGGAYLIYLGVRRMIARPSPVGVERVPRRRLQRAFVDGMVVNVLNPKTALFFLAFLPQFVDPSRGSIGGQVLSLGALFVALGLVTDGCYAVTAGSAARWLRRHPQFHASERWVSGGVYVGLGLVAALSSGHRK
jgi:threonine/homoserine/homoserine lactone efflux protein